jgi:dihydrolipoamide dehydrogenase
MADFEYDVAFIGAGPGGYVGAIRARQLGLKTLVVEKEKAGGVCLNIGCIPSKALIDRATKFRAIEELSHFGVRADLSAFDYGAVQESSRTAADRLSKGVNSLLKKNGVEYISGVARLSGAHEVTVRATDGTEKKIGAAAIVIATGSRPRVVNVFEFDEERVLSSSGFLMLKKLPKRLSILGAGAIGMEAAYVMNAFGVEVTVIEMLNRILPMEDAEAAAVVRSAFEKRGVRFMTETKAFSLDRPAKGPLSLAIGPASAQSAADKIETDALLVAIGRAPNTDGLGLEGLGVRLERGYVEVGDYYETAASDIYAIGDIVAGEAQLAHVAFAQGELVAERIAAKLGKGPLPHERRVEARFVPSAVYCEPQVAGFGLKEEALKAAGRSYKAAKFPYIGIGKAVAIGASEGFAKVLTDPRTGEILGAAVVGAEATELVHELLLASRAELTAEDVASVVHAHPTLSESIKEVALASLGRAIHI